MGIRIKLSWAKKSPTIVLKAKRLAVPSGAVDGRNYPAINLDEAYLERGYADSPRVVEWSNFNEATNAAA
ncbi:hypothetical protein AWA2013_12440 [Lactiplantibacillus plantarum]|nr:hypothetical protein AWA2013_12440 [Lactiplantibacillus plantarum]BEI63716.1 hypothetical protein IYO1511_c12010 [Lactiplantibacillus plantarum]